MTPGKRRLLTYTLLFLAMAILTGVLSKFDVRSNRAFHTNIATISAMASLFAGSLSMVRYYARHNCPYLWISIAFLGNSIIEFIYVYNYSMFPDYNAASLESTMVSGWWVGRLYLSSMLLASFLTCREKPVSGDWIAYAVGTPLLVIMVLLLLVFQISLPMLPSTVSRPLEYIPAVLFFWALAGYYRQFTWKKAEFYHWLILNLILSFAIQAIVIPFSRVIYDTQFMWANILRAVAHLLLSIGLLAEIFKLYGAAQAETKRLEVTRLMIDQIKDYALFMLDTTGHIATWNRGAQNIKGYTPDEIIGHHFSQFYPDEDNKAGKPAMELREAIKQGHYVDEGWRIKKDGSRFWALVIITPVYNETGELIGFSKVTKDLTEQKMAEEELWRNNALLMQSNEELQQFAYIATHDLKEPLRSISSFSELLARESRNINEKTATYADIIITAVRRLSRLIDDLRTYNLIGRQGPEQATVNMRQCVDDALNLLKKKMDESKAEIKIGALPELKGSPTQFTYLFLHLIDNSLKYAKPGIAPVITIKCNDSEIEYTFSVADNGVGIPKEYEERIFTIFKRLVSRERTEGSGIGLSICKKIVLLYGGNIWFQSNEDGTTFYFTLPKLFSAAHVPKQENYG